uniref:Phosphatidylinositol-specific phospholipase C X domain-containing protein n=1 Tax=Chromera velia CCMP2878 TaxID=1169474 RepID=A0A0G4HZH1_9ALVE|mmetsp:Transcript_17534/g.35593  ORF Transcript_17534/g.35593 Transcript_17534/m.35593 type:complete len:522 (+) Transcript_17534:102-1667(+)|eukprot:Cvel_9733.t1-p1 / transcript=Cvel_9733.t1 / gene=Cvel_9733 / organism=Chromera_velia_CCMP2878 / gene_product=hypothetical protein / transcript_product=hypothetical protein / location=Cvel_scaffold569:3767-5915(+) / protein_length=521 / sequence_SO=supercontig / SO=protein_coding / is_pseudo=false
MRDVGWRLCGLAWLLWLVASAYGDLSEPLLSDLRVLCSHDAGTGYLRESGYLKGTSPLYKWARTQDSPFKKQLECGARAFDIRAALTQSSSSSFSSGGNEERLQMHHGQVAIDFLLKEAVLEIVDWLGQEGNDEELVFLYVAECSHKGCDAAVAQMSSELGVPLFDDCMEIANMTVKEARERTRLPSGGHLMILKGCVKEHWDSEVECYGATAPLTEMMGQSTGLTGLQTANGRAADRKNIDEVLGQLDDVPHQGGWSRGSGKRNSWMVDFLRKKANEARQSRLLKSVVRLGKGLYHEASQVLMTAGNTLSSHWAWVSNQLWGRGRSLSSSSAPSEGSSEVEKRGGGEGGGNSSSSPSPGEETSEFSECYGERKGMSFSRLENYARKTIMSEAAGARERRRFNSPVGGGLWMLQGHWQYSAESIIIGTLHDSSVLEDQRRSSVNAWVSERVEEWDEMIRRESGGARGGLNWVELDDVCRDGGKVREALHRAEMSAKRAAVSLEGVRERDEGGDDTMWNQVA